MSFEELISNAEILKNLKKKGYTTPTPIQKEAIPHILKGSDLKASAQTGTGKTAAFILPSLIRLMTPSTLPGIGPRILILVPTRELAIQVAAETVEYSNNLPRMKTVTIFGGSPYPIQNRELSRPHEILVATPGRLIDHMERGRIDFSRLEVFILDEADRMLDMGFIDAVEQIAAAVPKLRQTLMFSATLKGTVLNLSKRLLNDPVEVNIAADLSKHENIEERLYYTDHLDHKYRLLEHILADEALGQVIVFTSTKSHADELMEQLDELGHNVGALHGGMNQRQRTKTITQLRHEKIRILIATDVAARGIDVKTITHVVNFDLPRAVEDYVHRIGRTGRAGSNGIAISFASHKDSGLVKQIERFTGQKMNPQTIPGLEPKTSHSSFPKENRFNPKPRGRFPTNRYPTKNKRPGARVSR